MKNIAENLTNKELRNFGLITGLIFTLLFAFLFPWLFERGWPLWPWFIAIPLWSTALSHPPLLKPVYNVWMTIGHILGAINTRIILGFMFYFVFTPFGVALRLLGKDPMARQINRHMKTYRIQIDSTDKNSMENPF